MTNSHDTTTQPLMEENLEEGKKVTEVPENLETEVSVEEPGTGEQPKTTSKPTKESVLKRAKELADEIEKASKQELDSLKQTFYRIHNAELEEDKKKFIESGGKEEEYVPALSNEQEHEFRNIMTVVREKRGVLAAKEEKQKEENLQAKLTIIEKLKELAESSEDTGKSYNEFKRLQQEWNETGQVPQGKVNEIWRSYQLQIEKFYDILRLNHEFRDYDFRKNLEIKTRLCEAVEKLAEEPDVVSAFHQLQKLHQEFRETGPVTKELRNEIWERFKVASTDVNRRYQNHFDELRETEQQNLDQKTVICEIIETIEYEELKTSVDWENKTKEIIALQNKWKTVGFVPQKMNVKIFERFRKACDEFFLKKGDFFKGMKEGMSENLKKKEDLCQKAEALKESTDWKETADILIKLQKEWRTVGNVPRKYSDVLWKRFIGACDYFFEQKGKATSSQRSVETENMTLKKAIIEKLAVLDESVGGEDAEVHIQTLIKEWGEIGHVPFKEKNKLYKEFHTLVDKHYERLNLDASHKKLSNYKSSISGFQGSSQTLYKEREKLVYTREHIKNDIQIYENNVGFFTSSSKKGENLLAEANRKIERLKGDLELVTQKIKVIDETIERP
ncbi:hypothetical protein EZS27_024691 [termite gut metagenome]|uniref:DUF349 domain-containing protein n=1 Tax=termite gut metagenome TaxID=433724 RepID=A0A5J4QYY6_9ZZZZ